MMNLPLQNITAQTEAINDKARSSATYGKNRTYKRRCEQYTKLLSHALHGYWCGPYDADSYHDEITKYLSYILPHGSGIDADWQFEFLKNGNILCHNSFHCMNNMGYYDGWIDFTVKIYRHKASEFRVLQGPARGKIQVVHRKGDVDFKISGPFHLRWNKYHYIKDYLYDTVGYALNGVITNRNEVL